MGSKSSQVKPLSRVNTNVLDGDSLDVDGGRKDAEKEDEMKDDIEDAANLAFAMQTGHNSRNMELTISCIDLPDLDRFSKTDGMVVLYIDKDGEMKESGKTEPQFNTLDPLFEKKFVISFNSELKQRVKFEIYDVDNERELDCLAKQDFIGYIESELSDIVNAGPDGFERPLISFKPTRKKKGIINIKCNESDIGQSKLSICLGLTDFSTRNYIKFRVMGNTYKKNNTELHKADYIKYSTKGIIFPEFAINSNLLIDESADLKFIVTEQKKGKDIDIGDVKISVLGLNNHSNSLIPISRNKVVVGKMNILGVKKVNKKTFLKYIYSDYCLKLMIAIDFSHPKSVNDQEFETFHDEVEEAITKLGTLMKYYDDDYRIPCIGFGGKLPSYYNVISNSFALNGNYFDPTIDGLENIVKAYRERIKEVKGHKSSIFEDIVKYATYVAKYFKEHEDKQYLVLLIITHGEIDDFDATVAELVRSTDLPLSVLIAGVGMHKEFPKMKELDADDQKLYSKRLQMESQRDIVNFLEFSK
jgi:hypothetical protein